ncbi:hypothetical protein, partial [Xanthomonas phaseoli]|uniref:hypothetical protein n=1 Tax=Xanthomonas phaseoli TaxID=1985254 RepID=UPI001ED917C2
MNITFYSDGRHGIREKSDLRHITSQAALLCKSGRVFGPTMPDPTTVASALMHCGSGREGNHQSNRQSWGTTHRPSIEPTPLAPHRGHGQSVQRCQPAPCRVLGRLSARLTASERCDTDRRA